MEKSFSVDNMSAKQGSGEAAICALATPPGRGGVAIIRLSGAAALEVARGVFKFPERIRARYMYFGKIVYNGELIDEALGVYFSAPNSYTGEDVVELQVHGGSIIAADVLSALIELGARMAKPGEFTRCAFMNGKLKLCEAEAVQEMISSLSVKGAREAARRLSGELSRSINEAEEALTDAAAAIEAAIEYPDEDIAPASPEELYAAISAVKSKLSELKGSYKRGRIYTEGLTAAIIGLPNVGKSSLVNMLSGEDRAIVTPIAGTTRDTLREPIYIDGLPVILIDTAGLRETGDTVERLGVERSRRAAEEAELVIFVTEAGRSLTEEERLIYDALPDEKRLLIYNKLDIMDAAPIDNALCISAKTGEGVPELKRRIREFAEADASTEGTGIAGARQYDALLRAERALSDALASLNAGALDLTGIDISDALFAIGELTGKTVSEEVVRRVFEKFCLGK